MGWPNFLWIDYNLDSALYFSRMYGIFLQTSTQEPSCGRARYLWYWAKQTIMPSAQTIQLTSARFYNGFFAK